MSDGLHIYTVPKQRATQYFLDLDERRIRIRNKPRALFYCHNCRRKRWAAHLVAMPYYDGTYFFCADGHGCTKTEGRRR